MLAHISYGIALQLVKLLYRYYSCRSVCYLLQLCCAQVSFET